MPEIPKLTGRIGDATVQLREALEWDIPEILIAHQDDPQLHVLLGRARAPTGAQLGSEIDSNDERRRRGEGVSLTLLEPGDRYCAGRLDISDIDWAARRATLRVWVAPQLRGRGLAAHALSLASAWLRERAGLTELTVALNLDVDPAAARGRSSG